MVFFFFFSFSFSSSLLSFLSLFENHYSCFFYILLFFSHFPFLFLFLPLQPPSLSLSLSLSSLFSLLSSLFFGSDKILCVQYRDASQFLQLFNQALSRCFLSVLLSSYHPNIDHLTLYIIALHGQPDLLLLQCLDDELAKTTELSVVAREKTPTVCVLKQFLRPFHRRIEILLSGFLKLGEMIKQKEIDFLVKATPCEHDPNFPSDTTTPRLGPKIRKKFIQKTTKLLSADLFPLSLCILCHRVALLIEQTPNLQRDEETPIENWAVSALIFLRCVIPMVIPRTHSSSKEGLTFLGRFLMKLATRSKFHVECVTSGVTLSSEGDDGGDSLINTILEDCFELYNQFCVDFRKRGRDSWEGRGLLIAPTTVINYGLISESGVMDLFEFLERNQLEILRESKSVSTSPMDIQRLFTSLQRELKKKLLVDQPAFGVLSAPPDRLPLSETEEDFFSRTSQQFGSFVPTPPLSLSGTNESFFRSSPTPTSASSCSPPPTLPPPSSPPPSFLPQARLSSPSHVIPHSSSHTPSTRPFPPTSPPSSCSSPTLDSIPITNFSSIPPFKTAQTAIVFHSRSHSQSGSTSTKGLVFPKRLPPPRPKEE